MISGRRAAVTLYGIVGLVPVAYALLHSGLDVPAWRVVVHILLLLIASTSPIIVNRVTVSLIFPVILPALVTMNPGTAGLVGALGSIQKAQVTAGASSLLPNRAIVGLPCLLASSAYHYLSGSSELWSIQSIVSVIIASYLYTLANNLLAVVGIKIKNPNQELRAFSMMVNHLRSFTFSLSIGLVMTFVYTVSEAFFILLVVLFYLNRETFYATIVNQNLYAQIINAMVKVIENVDPYTKGHSERVAAYSQAIGRAMGFKPLDLNRLHLIAMLHDLGKQSVPAEILRKKGELTDEEYPLIKKHPEKGADMLRGISLFSPIHLRAISEHHERWDGRGYPKGLAGDEINPWARIIAVADAFDAMTTDRPYRPAIDPKAALRELQRNAGTQFDPRVVSLFTTAFETTAVQDALKSRVDHTPSLQSSDEAKATRSGSALSVDT